MLIEIAGGEAGPVIDTHLEDQLPGQQKVRLRADRVKRLLGVEIPDSDEVFFVRVSHASACLVFRDARFKEVLFLLEKDHLIQPGEGIDRDG